MRTISPTTMTASAYASYCSTVSILLSSLLSLLSEWGGS